MSQQTEIKTQQNKTKEHNQQNSQETFDVEKWEQAVIELSISMHLDPEDAARILADNTSIFFDRPALTNNEKNNSS